MGRDEYDAVQTPKGPSARGKRRFGAHRMSAGGSRNPYSQGGRLQTAGFERVAKDVGHHRCVCCCTF